MNIKSAHIIIAMLTLPFFLNIMTKQASGQAAWTSSGPPGGYVNSIVFAPSVQGVVYAGTISGVYKSSDDGATWSSAGLRGIEINTVLVDPENTDIVYAGVGRIPGYEMGEHDGLYKSIDAGNSWTKKYETWVTAIAIDPGNVNTLYIGTKSGEILKSQDGGVNWELKHTENASDLVEINSILVDPENSSTIFVGTGGGYRLFPWDGTRGFLKSTDAGETWTGLHIGFLTPWDKGVSLAITPLGHSPQTLYIISSGDDGYGDIVFMSTDKGENWAGLFVPVFDQHRSARTLFVDHKDPNWVVVGTNNPDYPLIALNYSEMQWADLSNGLPGNEPSFMASSPHNPDNALTAYREGRLYRSTNYADDWNIAGHGLNNSIILDIGVHPLHSGSVLAAIEGNFPIQKTINEGDSWSDLAPNFLKNFTTIAIGPKDPNRIFVGTCGGNWPGHIFRSDDSGESWTQVDVGNLSGRVKDLWIHPINTDTILALKEHRSSYAGGVRRSTDGGNTWDQTYNWHWPNCLASDPNNPDIVYLGVERLGYVFRSANGGLTWTNISPGDNWNNVFDIVIDSESNILIAATEFEDNSMDGIWKWNHSDWTHLYQFDGFHVNSLAIDRRTNPGTLYAGTNGEGVFVSVDGGESWTPFNDGLATTDITRLEISQSEPYTLYAGTNYGGIWSIPLEKITRTITAHAGENGTIVPTGEVNVEYGDDQTFTITPDEGFQIAFVTVDGIDVDMETDENWDAESGQYTFANVTENHTIEVGFDDVTSMSIVEKNEIKVYPSPAINELWIELNNQGSEKLVIVLQNLQGQTVKQVSVNKTGKQRISISVHDLVSGVYLLTIRGKQVFQAEKVIVGY